ncbi:hypothetical protein AKJ59_00490 [candidate division MSBL1 archaeon SCGC-AAA385M02]|uniref:Uncharacterized protein n=1 Tax=candidate division MSBL1 archaeon SCGC-AAA385M02 TaxID=1698287 RepID=A0A133VQR3_9EURY|nr:hypothetical protein AKJ59_00490 [candidate division MSBL1 archaeon SCGC-AAA385M02]
MKVGAILKITRDGDYDWLQLWVPKDDGEHHFGDASILHYENGMLIQTGTTNFKRIDEPNPETLSLDEMMFGWLDWRLFQENTYNRGE